MAKYSVDQFVKNNSGRGLDFDGWYGDQCVDLINFYNRDVVGAGRILTPLTGYAKDWWNNFERSAETKKHYVRISKNAKPQKGDIAVWQKYNGNGLPHIAVVLGQTITGKLKTFTQNPGPAHVANLSKKGLAGYLRPKKYIKAQPKPKPSSKKTKKSIDTIAREVIAGKWGNGQTRIKKLKKAGYDPKSVQKKVNQLL